MTRQDTQTKCKWRQIETTRLTKCLTSKHKYQIPTIIAINSRIHIIWCFIPLVTSQQTSSLTSILAELQKQTPTTCYCGQDSAASVAPFTGVMSSKLLTRGLLRHTGISHMPDNSNLSLAHVDNCQFVFGCVRATWHDIWDLCIPVLPALNDRTDAVARKLFVLSTLTREPRFTRWAATS